MPDAFDVSLTDTGIVDGRPGFPVEGWPGVRVGAFGSGRGLLGILIADKKAGAPVVYDPKAEGCPGPYDTRHMEVTGYTSGPESTGKRPGQPGYGVGRYQKPVGPGTIAAEHPPYNQGDQIFVPGYGVGAVNDTGGAIKGARLDLWFPTVERARKWGRRKLDVDLQACPSQDSIKLTTENVPLLFRHF